MEDNKMTIHRGLTELKLLDKKIHKKIQTFHPTGLLIPDGNVDKLIKKEDFEKEAKAKLKSIQDLMKRKQKIKSAINKANQETSVTIAGETMKISEAINHRQMIDLKVALRDRIQPDLNASKSSLEIHNLKVEEKALGIAMKYLEKDNVKINDNDVMNMMGPYLKANLYTLSDPLAAQKLIEKLTEEIDNFEAEIDATLSEINAITYIEV